MAKFVKQYADVHGVLLDAARAYATRCAPGPSRARSTPSDASGVVCSSGCPGGQSWSRLANAQAGMLSQRQLTELRVSRSFVRNQLRARRWVQRTSSVLSTTTGPLFQQQRLWQAVLHAGPTALIGGLGPRMARSRPPSRTAHHAGSAERGLRGSPSRRAPEFRALLHDIAGELTRCRRSTCVARANSSGSRPSKPEGSAGSRGSASMDRCRVGPSGRVRAGARGGRRVPRRRPPGSRGQVRIQVVVTPTHRRQLLVVRAAARTRMRHGGPDRTGSASNPLGASCAEVAVLATTSAHDRNQVRRVRRRRNAVRRIAGSSTATGSSIRDVADSARGERSFGVNGGTSRFRPLKW